MKKLFPGLILFTLLFGCGSKSTPEEPGGEAATGVPEALPFIEISLGDLSAFEPAASNWSVAGRVISDHTREHHLEAKEGTGVLVNQNSDAARDNLFTRLEHGDMELDVEVMMPKGSNSGIYFQGRYEIQLFDSWQVEEPQHSDCGGIYQRWDDSRPEGQQGYEGHAPRLNAAKAPGLWQHFYIVFRAPRFDAQGNKTENARFEKVVHNGVVIHEDVELTGPTRAAVFEDEAPLGPLMIQGDHGPVAFRNMKYKVYFSEALTLDDLRYQYFEIENPLTAMPGFDTLQAVRQGETDSLVFEKLSEREERVAYIFTGTLQAPSAGDYLFHAYSDDGSQLFIDGEMLIDNDGKHDFESKRGRVHLGKGPHDFELRYFNNNWGKGLMVLYEGPQMKLQPLLSRVPERRKGEGSRFLIEPEVAPEMVRSFVMHKGEKITHAISVGDPKGLHYTVDLRNGALLKFWRGAFADVTQMWYQRGEPQLLHPLEMAVEVSDGIVASLLEDGSAAYPAQRPEYFRFRGYEINSADQPVFRYQVDQALVLDHYQPSADGTELIRTITSEQGEEHLYCRLAVEDYIEETGNGYYSVGGAYYINLRSAGKAPLIRESGGRTEMLFPLSGAGDEVKYAILW